MKFNFKTKLLHPYRILIYSELRNGSIGFVELRHRLDTTAGNLASHIRVLRKLDCIDQCKDFVNNKPRTTYTMTSTFREEMDKVKAFLEKALPKE